MIRCSVCHTLIQEGVPTRVCSECHQQYHENCWDGIGGCATYGCEKVAPAEKPEPVAVQGTGWGDPRATWATRFGFIRWARSSPYFCTNRSRTLATGSMGSSLYMGCQCAIGPSVPGFRLYDDGSTSQRRGFASNRLSHGLPAEAGAQAGNVVQIVLLSWNQVIAVQTVLAKPLAIILHSVFVGPGDYPHTG